MCTHCILLPQLLLFLPLLYIGDCIYIFLAFIFPSCYSVPLYLKKKTIPASQSRNAGTIFECLKCDRTSGNWLIISSLLHPLIYIRNLNFVVFSFSFFLLTFCPNAWHSLPSRWVLFSCSSDSWSVVTMFPFSHCKNMGSLLLLPSATCENLSAIFINTVVEPYFRLRAKSAEC